MGSFNSNILPATTGLALGNSNQQWLAYLSNVFSSTFQSNSVNPALSGILRLASTDFIAWRNNLNTGDVTLAKTGAAANNVPTDSLVWSPGGIVGKFISNSANPAAGGAVRLNTTDTITFRNNSNGADISGLSHNTDDTVTVGDAAGIKQTIVLANPFKSSVSNPASAGVIRLANNDALNWRNAANNADEGLVVDANDRLVNSCTNGLLINGTNPTILLGGTTSSFPMLKRVGAAVAIRTAGDLFDGNLTVGAITSINGLPTAGGSAGVAAEVGFAAQLSQTAAIGSTLLYTTLSGTGAPTFRVSWYAQVLTAAGTSSTLGPLTITYTDQNSVGQSITCGAMVAAGTIATTSTANTTTTLLAGIPFLIRAKVGTAINYAFGYASNAANVMTYNLDVRLEAI